MVVADPAVGEREQDDASEVSAGPPPAPDCLNAIQLQRRAPVLVLQQGRGRGGLGCSSPCPRNPDTYLFKCPMTYLKTS